MERCRSPFCHNGKVRSLTDEQMASFGSSQTDGGIGITVTTRDPVSEATVNDCDYCGGTGVESTYPSQEEIEANWAAFEVSNFT